MGEFLKQVSDKIKVEIPEVLVEKEKSRMLEATKAKISRDFKIDFKDYLDKIKKTEKELLDSFSFEAEDQIKRILFLREIRKKENIDVSDKEVEERINLMIKHYKNTEQMKDIDIKELKLYTKEEIMNGKILQKLGELIGK